MKKLGNYVVNTTFTKENMDNPAYAELPTPNHRTPEIPLKPSL